MNAIDKIRADADRRQRERQNEYRELSKLTGKPIAKLERDWTKPDPRLDCEH